jgi:antitoxin component YwqK of YwqJK toxin-antitoxin module
MTKIIFTLLLMLSSFISICQEKQDRTLYIIDSIPVIDTPDDAEQLDNEDIDKLEIVTDLEKIKSLGYEGKVDKIMMITTKAYATRPDDVKSIPSTKKMTRVNGLWYYKNPDQPYSGKFIDYFANGKIQGDGVLENGKVEGIRTVYYLNSSKRYFYTYSNGLENGPSEEYFINGKLKQKGIFVNKKEEGLWQVFYSTGKLKRESNFINNKQMLGKEELKFYELLSKGATHLKEGEYTNAIRKLDDAIKLNMSYADLYFYRGTAKLNNFDFDKAIDDFDQAIALEPLYMEAISNRAFARLRKYEFKDARTLSNSKKITIMAAKDMVSIPKDDLDKICADLKLGYELGDRKPMVIDAMKRYCN